METVLDQHFLRDEKILNEIVASSELNKKDIVLEIGPGNGKLTKLLLKKVNKVIAVELDEKFKDHLNKLGDKLEIIFGNILDIIEKYKFNKVISNIPYSITEPLFKKLYKLKVDFCVLTIGENFYKLLNGESKWNTIVNSFYNINLIRKVKKESFEPIPRVDSVVIKMVLKENPDKFEKIIQSFALQDDKKVKNAIIKILHDNFKLTNNQSKEKLNSLKIPGNILEKNVDYISNLQFNSIIKKLKEI